MPKFFTLLFASLFCVQQTHAAVSMMRALPQYIQRASEDIRNNELSDADLAEFEYNMQGEFNEDGSAQHQMLNDAGYLAGSQYVATAFYLDPVVSRVFPELFRTLRSMPSPLSATFQQIKIPIRNYIEQYRRATFRSNPNLYNMSFDEAAEKITRAGFCFKIDPKVVVAKLQQETKFDRTATSVNGTGMSQLVNAGISEVFDQLGGRPGQAPDENIAFFNSAVDCFIGRPNSAQTILWNQGVTKNVSTISAAQYNRMKQLILNNFDLDLIFGHIVLKVNLMLAARTTRNTRAIYYTGLVNYNGSPRKIQYGNSVMSIYDQVSRSTAVIPNISL